MDVDGHTQAEADRLEQLLVSGMKSRVQCDRERLGAMLNECCAVDTGPSGAITSYARRDQSCC